jgi:hypothetical protein
MEFLQEWHRGLSPKSTILSSYDKLVWLLPAKDAIIILVALSYLSVLVLYIS